jgi:signal transduction histidine kinase
MLPKSIRWRLPLSYAAIALLTVLALGLVLLTTLRGYYLQQELAYLDGNARAIGTTLTNLLQADAPPQVLESQLRSLAFLSQTRIRLLDLEAQTVADSGPPQERRQVAAVSLPGATGYDWTAWTPGVTTTLPNSSSGTIVRPATETEAPAEIVVIRPLSPTSEITSTTVAGPDVIEITVPRVDVNTMTSDAPSTLTGTLGYFVSAVGTPYGFGLDAETIPDPRRSGQMVQRPLLDASGQLLGFVQLSEGPAYGRQILNSVAWGWAIAGGAAVSLAAVAGWGISRRMSTPLMVLTDVTERMAQGDLAARADVTREDELGHLAGSFNEMAEQVEATVVALRRFVADAAHELHTPLTALRTNLELLSDQNRSRPDQPFAQRALAQLERLENLTQGLLDLSRLEGGKAQKKPVPIDLTALVQEIGEQYASRAEQAGLSFHQQMPLESVPVLGNEGQLRRAVNNLLDNACKFTPKGGQVRMVLERKGEWAELGVQDTGIGIPPQDLPHLFERFHRGRNAAAYPGSGLGLAIVKAVVRQHGGQVVAEIPSYTVEKGAHFQIRLPLLRHQPAR